MEKQTLWAEAMRLLGYADFDAAHSVYGMENGAALQAWCAQAIAYRREWVVPVPHHVRVFKTRLVGALRSPEHRREAAGIFGFDLAQPFFGLLETAGIWAPIRQELKIEGLIPDYDSGEFTPDILNALNGMTSIDYEGLFPSAADIFFALKRHKFHMDDRAIAASSNGPSPLSTVDIFSGVILDRDFNRAEIRGTRRTEIVHALARVLDTRIPNFERAADVGRVRELERCLGDSCSQPLRSATAALYGPSAQRRFGGGHPVRDMDAFVPLSMCDLARAVARTRELVIGKCPDAFVFPSGGNQPHQIKEGLAGGTDFGEADEIYARLLSSAPEWRAGLYGEAEVQDTDPLRASDVLPTPSRVCDTAGNADDIAARVSVLRRISGRPLTVGIVAPPIFIARACAHARSRLPESDAEIFAVTAETPFFQPDRWSEYGFIVQLQVMLSEWLKRLYMVCVE